MKKFNINSHMYVQITKEGFAHLKKTVTNTYLATCIESAMVEIDGEKWYKLQCHQVFALLPNSAGSKLLFRTSVMFDEKDLESK